MKQNLWRLLLLSFILLSAGSFASGQGLEANGKSGIVDNNAQSASLESVLARVRSLDSVTYRVGWTLDPGEFHQLSREALKYGTAIEFKTWLKDGNPLVRVMALICLANVLDVEKFAEIAQTLSGDDAKVKYTNGCSLNRKGTVGSIAAELAEQRFLHADDDKRGVQ